MYTDTVDVCTCTVCDLYTVYMYMYTVCTVHVQQLFFEIDVNFCLVQVKSGWIPYAQYWRWTHVGHMCITCPTLYMQCERKFDKSNYMYFSGSQVGIEEIN